MGIEDVLFHLGRFLEGIGRIDLTLAPLVR